MLAFAAALLAGPQWRASSPAGRGSILAVVPLLVLAGGIVAACLVTLPPFDIGRSVHCIVHVILLAGGATAICLVLAIPASLARPGPGWLVLACLALVVGPAGWSVAPLPSTALAATFARAVLLLPLMAIGLGAAWSRLPAHSWGTASSLGARAPAILLAALRVTWPDILRSCLGVTAVAGVLGLV